MKERLQKILSREGFGSRRDCEYLIQNNRVKINGIIATIGMTADSDIDQIKVDEKIVKITRRKEKFYIVYKPKNVLSDIKKRDDRTIVRELVPDPEYLFIVGRLDYDSEGLIIFTNNGEIANRLTHPRYGHDKEYAVLVKETPTLEKIQKWEAGIFIDKRKTQPVHAQVLEVGKTGTWIQVVMKEGRKREIREVCRILGLNVKRLVRVRIETVELGKLRPGECRILTELEVKILKGAIGVH